MLTKSGRSKEKVNIVKGTTKDPTNPVIRPPNYLTHAN